MREGVGLREQPPLNRDVDSFAPFAHLRTAGASLGGSAVLRSLRRVERPAAIYRAGNIKLPGGFAQLPRGHLFPPFRFFLHLFLLRNFRLSLSVSGRAWMTNTTSSGEKM
jgi:hypothetical protein